MSSEVLPAPVGPMMRLIFPRLKKTSSSSPRTNVRRRVPPGVTATVGVSAAQVKDAWRMPMESFSSSGTDVVRISVASGFGDSVYSSMSSVCEVDGQR